jgi:hypothetical protein
LVIEAYEGTDLSEFAVERESSGPPQEGEK